jgi:hypothetical protein
MSARSGIAKAFADSISNDINGTGLYVNNLYGGVTNKVIHFDNINSFPFISVNPGPEIRDDMPARITHSTLTLYIRIYVENQEDAQGELESLIADIETFIDTHLNISYNITTPAGVETHNTITNQITAISTDEGILDPNAVGEIALEVIYEKVRKTL